MKRALQAAVICATVVVPALAQMDPDCPMHKKQTEPGESSPYVGRTDLPIKALTSEALDAYRKGTGMGMAIPAELNGYPGPRHVLDLAEKMQVTSEQRSRLQAIFDPMHTEAVRLGAEIIDLERKLDAGFAQSKMTEAQLTALTRDIAERQGRLRLNHLRAHIATREVLTPAQIQAYNSLRGYSADAATDAHHGHTE